MKYKRPISVLVVIYAKETKRVLMLKRRDDPDFWQSVTGSLEAEESPFQTALREVQEEVGIDIIKENLELVDCHRSILFEIFAHFRHRYAPDVTHCQEHWFTLALPTERDIVLTEHSQYQWLDAPLAAKLTKSASNQQAIEEFVI
ncbi:MULTISPECIES: dihydroneopterin triphosphate diphosphatase [Proteus]|uniref:dihydroneopterin triphosphate diphosphatase n=1 Tax=Proteus TaxID=583 RepID=UPI0013A5B0BE|nr:MULTISPECIES: dihydroneopterin triphosphate diphosphatase [Proteus]MBG2836039.1 dihydroneopterin triphosphate diphosphatase [Proteus terrae subsp. cibarius]MBG2867317.1 dihydroneopterin triphosphate diphosphatase [Proteus terrae subsp. cibarius]MBJ2107878.1 dihydroneopterin triphosphate diphosphatase [Proteus terrae]MBJ2131750.1 dihydroneopterin triphosphate diphosphatase [Proteus terrae]MCO7048369.1 dihydroneopterin triphosphate diphosphatase [Proteus terrae]